MLVETIMSQPVKCISPDQPLIELRDIFNKEKYHHLLVEEKGKLVGVISDRDVSRHLSPFLDTDNQRPQDEAQLNIPTKEIMTTKLVTVVAGTPIDCAAILLLENNISCIPIVGKDNLIAGILTWKDILQYYVYIDGNENLASNS